jgi:hypothetical protein
MKKKASPGPLQFASNPKPTDVAMNWRNVPGRDLWLYARSFHTAARKLAGVLEIDANSFTDFDACPVIFLYRHSIELHLKAIILGDGGNFLATKPDALSIQKTHSLSWLAQFVCQIITALKWETEFKCEGVENLAEFKAAVEELNAVDPGSYVFRFPVSTQKWGSSKFREFARRLDAILVLLDSTADAMAATWDMQTQSAEAQLNGGDNVEPTIQ